MIEYLDSEPIEIACRILNRVDGTDAKYWFGIYDLRDGERTLIYEQLSNNYSQTHGYLMKNRVSILRSVDREMDNEYDSDLEDLELEDSELEIRPEPTPKPKTVVKEKPIDWYNCDRKPDSFYNGHKSWAISGDRVDAMTEKVAKGEDPCICFRTRTTIDFTAIFSAIRKRLEPIKGGIKGQPYYRVRPGELLEKDVYGVFTTIEELECELKTSRN